MRSYITIRLVVDHDDGISLNVIHDACDKFEGETLIEIPDPRDPAQRLSAIVDTVESVSS